MASPEQVEAAHQRMQRAEEALRAYVNRANREVDIPRHLELSDELALATATFLRLRHEVAKP